MTARTAACWLLVPLLVACPDLGDRGKTNTRQSSRGTARAATTATDATAPDPAPPVVRSYFGPAPDGKLHVYFFDVEGDAALFLSPTGRTALVARASSMGALTHRLPELLSGPVDLLVLTHVDQAVPRGLLAAIRRVGARAYLETPTLAGHGALHQLLRQEHLEAIVPAPDSRRPFEPFTLSLGPECELRVLWPQPLNAGTGVTSVESAVLRVDFKKTSLLLTSDAQQLVHRKLLERAADLSATVLQLASDTPASEEWEGVVRAARPQAAIATGRLFSGRAAVLELERVGVRLFRTDLDGELHLASDGEGVTVRTQRPAAGEAPGKLHVVVAPTERAPTDSSARTTPAAARKSIRRPAPHSEYVASKNSGVFHRPTCHTVKKIQSKNLLVYGTRQDAERERKPAQDCDP